MSIVLGIDTALGQTSVSLCDGARELAGKHVFERESQASSLLSWVEAVLRDAGMWYEDVDTLSVAIGPGGFTGIRVGLAAARGIALAAKKPLVGFSTLEMMACVRGAGGGTAIHPAGRGMVFVQSFQGIMPQDAARMVLQEEGVACASDEIVTTIEGLEVSCPVRMYDVSRSAYVLCQLAQNSDAKAHAPTPLYIRPPDAKLPTKAAF